MSDDNTPQTEEFEGADAGAGGKEARRELEDLDRSEEMESHLEAARESAKDVDLPDLPGIPEPSEVENDAARTPADDDEGDERAGADQSEEQRSP